MVSFPTAIYYIRPDDTREDILREVITAHEARVLLVFPARMDLIVSSLDLVLIYRQTQSSSHQVAAATRNLSVRASAQEAGFPVFPTVARARRQNWSPAKPGGFQANTADHRTNAAPIPRPFRHYQFPSLQKRAWWEWLLFAVGFITLLLLVVFLLSSAEIIIQPKSTTQAISLTFTGSPKVLTADLAGHLPVHEINLILDAEGSSNSSGTLKLPEVYAQGEVRLINLQDKTIEVPQGLILRTLSSPAIQFKTTVSTMLEPGEENGQIVPIQALLPGDEGNVSADTIQGISGVLGAELSINNPLPTSGGLTRQVKTPTEADVNALRESLLIDLYQQAQDAFAASLEAETEYLIAGTIVTDEVIAEEILPTPGETAESFHLTLRVRFKAWMVSTNDLQSVAQALLNASLSSHEAAVEQTMEILPVSNPILISDQVQWDVLIHQKIQTVLDASILPKFTAQPGKLLANWLDMNLDLNADTVIHYKPFWWHRLPLFPSRMQVITQ